MPHPTAPPTPAPVRPGQPGRPGAVLATVVLASTALVLASGCAGPGASVPRGAEDLGIIGTQRCIAPFVEGGAPQPVTVSQFSARTGLQGCIIALEDAAPEAEGPVADGQATATAVAFTLTNPGTTEVALPADLPRLVRRDGHGSEARPVAQEGRLLPEALPPGGSVSARVAYELDAQEREQVRISWDDLVWSDVAFD